MTICPRDSSPLKEKIIGRTEGEVCPTCGGTWLNYEAVKVLYKSTYIHAPSQIYHDSQPHIEYKSWDSDINCPKDGKRLTRYEFRNVEIDVCSSCKGLWLDEGELSKLHFSKLSEILFKLIWYLSYIY